MFLRQLRVEKVDDGEAGQRLLPQLHFTNWPDQGVPELPDTLIG